MTHIFMELRAFTSQLPHGGVTAFAANLGITKTYLASLSGRHNGRLPSPELCVRIESLSKKQVRRWDTRPDDWHRIWPELIGKRGAPKVPAAAEKA